MAVLLSAEPSGASFPTLLALLLIGGSVYALGFRRAVMIRAKSDYQATKVGLPKLRKAFWLSLWAAVKVGFWVVLMFALLLAWVVHEARRGG